VSYLSRALASAAGSERGEVLIDLGLAERLIDPNAAADHLTEGLSLLDDVVRRAEVAIELGGELFYADRLEEAIAVYRRAYDEIDEAEHPDLHQRLEAEVAASAWWGEAHYPIAAELMEAFDARTLDGGFGGDLLGASPRRDPCLFRGETVENPVTGERLTFRETARETGGEYTRFEALIAPAATSPRATCTRTRASGSSSSRGR
jgi:hypothetical protein